MVQLDEKKISFSKGKELQNLAYRDIVLISIKYS